MAMQELFAYQGQQLAKVLQIVNSDGTNATNIYTSGSVLSASFWLGQNQASLFSPVVSWYTAGSTQTGYGQGQFNFGISAAQSTGLDPAGEYYTLVTQTTSGVSSAVWEGRVKILATPGSTSPSPPDLASYDFIEAYCSELPLTDTQRDVIPYFATAASIAIRRYCFGRNFDLRTYVKKFDVTLDGTIRLDQLPIQLIRRVQGPPQLALTVFNNASSVQAAQVYAAYSGQIDSSGSTSQTLTGLVCNSVSSGVATAQTVTITSTTTIQAVATAIVALGGGWQATADTVLGLWNATEIDGAYTAQGCSSSAVPSGGAQFNVLTDLSNSRLDDPLRGFLWVGRQYANSDAARWGPGGDDMFQGSVTGGYNLGQVKVTFDAGETIIPLDIQTACAALVKWKLELAKQELLLMEEKAADYSYRLSEQMVAAIPKPIREALSQWRIHYA